MVNFRRYMNLNSSDGCISQVGLPVFLHALFEDFLRQADLTAGDGAAAVAAADHQQLQAARLEQQLINAMATGGAEPPLAVALPLEKVAVDADTSKPKAKAKGKQAKGKAAAQVLDLKDGDEGEDQEGGEADLFQTEGY